MSDDDQPFLTIEEIMLLEDAETLKKEAVRLKKEVECYQEEDKKSLVERRIDLDRLTEDENVWQILTKMDKLCHMPEIELGEDDKGSYIDHTVLDSHTSSGFGIVCGRRIYRNGLMRGWTQYEMSRDLDLSDKIFTPLSAYRPTDANPDCEQIMYGKDIEDEWGRHYFLYIVNPRRGRNGAHLTDYDKGVYAWDEATFDRIADNKRRRGINLSFKKKDGAGTTTPVITIKTMDGKSQDFPTDGFSTHVVAKWLGIPYRDDEQPTVKLFSNENGEEEVKEFVAGETIFAVPDTRQWRYHTIAFKATTAFLDMKIPFRCDPDNIEVSAYDEEKNGIKVIHTHEGEETDITDECKFKTTVCGPTMDEWEHEDYYQGDPVDCSKKGGDPVYIDDDDSGWIDARDVDFTRSDFS